MCLFNPTEVITLSDLRIAPVRSKQEVWAFLNAYHYLGARGVPVYKHALGVWADITLMGVGVFGRPVARHECKAGVIELRRFCLIDSLPRNAESYTLSRMLRWLKAQGYRRVITYSDPSVGHRGTIYKAVGMHCEGYTDGGDWNRARRPRRQASSTTPKLKWSIDF